MALKLRTITMDELDGFKIDDATGQLYWQDSKVRTRLSLPDWAAAAAVCAATATVIQAVLALIDHFQKWGWI